MDYIPKDSFHLHYYIFYYKNTSYEIYISSSYEVYNILNVLPVILDNLLFSQWFNNPTSMLLKPLRQWKFLKLILFKMDSNSTVLGRHKPKNIYFILLARIVFNFAAFLRNSEIIFLCKKGKTIKVHL